MGFISAMARCMRENKFSRKHRTPKPQRLDDETNDLIETNSHNGSSLAQAESIASASTGMQYSAHEPIPPIKSPKRKQLSPADLNLQTLFDNGKALDAATDPTARALAIPEYPVYKLDMTPSPADSPTKKLQDPIDPEKETRRKSVEWMDEKLRKEISVPKVMEERDVPERKEAAKLRRSKTQILRKHLSVKIARAPRSSRNLRGHTSPSWIDASDLADEESLINVEEEKWLEAHGLGGGKNIGMWTGGGLGRPW